MPKKSSGQETGLGNRGRLKVLKDTKLFLNKHEWQTLSHLGSIQNLHTSPIPQTSILGFYWRFLQQDSSTYAFVFLQIKFSSLHFGIAAALPNRWHQGRTKWRNPRLGLYDMYPCKALMLCNRVGWENFHSINKNSVLGYPAAFWQPRQSN